MLNTNRRAIARRSVSLALSTNIRQNDTFCLIIRRRVAIKAPFSRTDSAP
jgi:hypothetical protein